MQLMPAPAFPPDAHAAFAAAYPQAHTKLTHRLLDHPLMTLDALAQLAGSLPAPCVEYHPGRLPIGIAPEDIPAAEVGVVEAIRSIDTSGCWVVLKRIEQDPAYAALLGGVLAELAHVITPRTGPMLQLEGFVFVSSPGAVTPFHFDPEHNILLQLRGTKVMTLFPGADASVFPDTVQEAFHLGQHHRNLPWDDSYAAYGQPVALAPGEAVHVPVKVPHWVQNGPVPSISLSLTWRSPWSYAEADARAFNHLLRKFGLRPARPAAYPAHNLAKSLAWRTYRKLRGAA